MKYLLTLLCILAPCWIWAQGSEGIISYTESRKLKIELPPEIQNSGVKIPDKRTAKMELLFNEQEGLYRNSTTDEPESTDIDHQDGGLHIKMKFSSPENILYSNLEDAHTLNQQEFMGKMFLVEGKRNDYQWKISAEQRQMDQFLCIKATHTDSSQTIVAWFTPQIPVSLGPANLGGLPGMILDADINDGETTFQVTSVTLMQLEEDEIAAPTKGKKMSHEAFEAIVAEKTREMQEGDGGVNVIKVIRN